MNALSGQFDLFDLDPGYRETPRRMAPVRRGRQPPGVVPGTEDGLVQLLEDTGRFKVLRKLAPRPVIDRANSKFPRLAVLVDVETTGLNHSRDEVIEIGAVAFRGRNKICFPRHAKPEQSMNVMRREGGALAA